MLKSNPRTRQLDHLEVLLLLRAEAPDPGQVRRRLRVRQLRRLPDPHGRGERVGLQGMIHI